MSKFLISERENFGVQQVRTRAPSLMMPYTSILPVIIEPVMEGDFPYTILHPDMPTSLEDLQRDWIQIKRERDTFEA